MLGGFLSTRNSTESTIELKRVLMWREPAVCGLLTFRLSGCPGGEVINQHIHRIVGVGKRLFTRDAPDFLVHSPPAIKFGHEHLGEPYCSARWEQTAQ